MTRSQRGRHIRRVAGGAAFFLIGGGAAAGLSFAKQPQHENAAMRVAIATPASPNRVAVSAASLRQAYAAGMIVRPI
jgi:hypothetical protein